ADGARVAVVAVGVLRAAHARRRSDGERRRVDRAGRRVAGARVRAGRAAPPVVLRVERSGAEQRRVDADAVADDRGRLDAVGGRVRYDAEAVVRDQVAGHGVVDRVLRIAESEGPAFHVDPGVRGLDDVA